MESIIIFEITNNYELWLWFVVNRLDTKTKYMHALIIKKSKNFIYTTKTTNYK